MAKPPSKKPVEALQHVDAKRKNIPTAEFQPVLQEEDRNPIHVAYERRNPDLDPQLVWRGKDVLDWSDLVVTAPHIYLQEKVHPKILIDDLRRQTALAEGEKKGFQADLFADFNGLPKGADRTAFYQYDQNWANRMILGDSLQVMASLAERESLRGKVQCIYFDPPYGIKFNSNFQWSTTSRDVKDGSVAHITREPEQVKAFRDTWRDGIHSYLTYLRDRLTVARDLLTESGSIFVQIGDENVHRVRALMDEVFGERNFCSIIQVQKTGSQAGNLLANTVDFVLWAGKNKSEVKYCQLYNLRVAGHVSSDRYDQVELADGSERRLSREELLRTSELGGRIFQHTSLISSGKASIEQNFAFCGRSYTPGPSSHWKTTVNGLSRLAKARRVAAGVSTIRYKRFKDDFSVLPITDRWESLQIGTELTYVVQTSTSVAERCLLMATDPGDLVLDPTCVRKGTRVWARKVAAPPLAPPVNGGRTFTPSPSMEISNNSRLPSLPSWINNTPSPFTGRAGVGADAVAGVGGLHPIETIQAGDFVLSHDNQYHRVLRVIEKPYAGQMIGLKAPGSDQTLWLTGDHRVLCRMRPRTLGGNRDWSASPVSHVEARQRLRRNATSAEKILWTGLRGGQMGAKFRRQHPVGPYIADFYSRDCHLVVEIDGPSHDTPEAVEYDRKRDQYMRALGLDVLRFTSDEILQNGEGVLAAIASNIAVARETFREAAWVQSRHILPGDAVFSLAPDVQSLIASEVCAVEDSRANDTVFDLEVEGAHSFVTEVCAVHNCGSGTTAYVAEQWGRRWITIDTSRVALALARARIMGARYPYYLLKDSKEGQAKQAEIEKRQPSTSPTYENVAHGFVYERVPHITLKSIANNADIDVIWDRWQETLEPLREALNTATKKAWQEWEIPREADPKWPEKTKKLHADWWQARIARQKEIDGSIAAKAEYENLYDRPYEDKKTVRVAGRFTVESLSPHRELSVDADGGLFDPRARVYPGHADRQSFVRMILENLKTAGVQQAHKEGKIDLTSLEPWPGRMVCAEGRYVEGANGASKQRRAAIMIGPEFGTVTRPDLVEAAREAADGGFDVLVACAFNFEAHTTEFDKLGRVPVLKARMNADLHMSEELKNTGKGNLFVVFGEPDMDLLRETDGTYRVKIKGVDVFHPNTGTVESNGPEGIACWFIDTNYNEESFFVRHAYFLGAQDPYKSLKTSLKAEVNEDAWASLHSDTSRPFNKPKTGRIAVKVINHLGDEVMKVFKV